MLILGSLESAYVYDVVVKKVHVRYLISSPGEFLVRCRIWKCGRIWPYFDNLPHCHFAHEFVFTALHGMHTPSSDENSVCPSVCPSVCLSHACNCDKTEERSVQIFIPYERSFSLVFWEEEWLVGGGPFYVKFWVNLPPLERNRRFSTNNRS